MSLILLVHFLLIGAWLSLGGMVVVLRHAEPLLVQLVASPEPRRVVVPPPVPLPTFRPPEIRLPQPPPVENLYVLRPEPIPAPAPQVVTPEPPRAEAPVPVAAAAPVLEPPRADMAYLNNPPPSYPQVSRRNGEQGRVLLRVHVTPDGRPEEIELQQSSGFERLDEAARAAVRRWRFVPARLGERAVAAWALVPVNFSLQR
jgi:protein TonB